MNLVGYLIHRPSLKIKYSRDAAVAGLDCRLVWPPRLFHCFRLGQHRIAQIHHRAGGVVHQGVGLLALKNAGNPLLADLPGFCLSSAEAEYYAASETAIEIIYLCNGATC